MDRAAQRGGGRGTWDSDVRGAGGQGESRVTSWLSVWVAGGCQVCRSGWLGVGWGAQVGSCWAPGAWDPVQCRLSPLCRCVKPHGGGSQGGGGQRQEGCAGTQATAAGVSRGACGGVDAGAGDQGRLVNRAEQTASGAERAAGGPVGPSASCPPRPGTESVGLPGCLPPPGGPAGKRWCLRGHSHGPGVGVSV